MDVSYQVDLIRKSGLFDREWYLEQYPDVAALPVDPVEHYVRWGALLLRDPGPGFDTSYYLETNPDVASSGLNPLAHYVRHGRRERRLPLAVASLKKYTRRVDIVVPVFNALDDVRECLRSVSLHRDGLDIECIVVNDGSNQETSEWLSNFCSETPGFSLIVHDGNRGYTKAVNTGLRKSAAPYVVTLNSDTIVTKGWLRALIRCMTSSQDVGIVGPLSNAASWQNVPSLLDEAGTFAVNQLPDGMPLDVFAALVSKVSARSYPKLPFINGFCFMIRREVIQAIGYMDEESFPLGYGEENDFCIRAADAGFALAVADDAFVFHAKSKSFGHDRRKELSRQGSERLREKHTRAKFEKLVAEVKKTGSLDEVRRRVQAALISGSSAVARDPVSMRVLFLLPVKGGGGGAHSVVQEVTEMRRLGVEAKVAVRAPDLDGFLSQYEDIPMAADVFVGFKDVTGLMSLASGYDVVVGTIFSSVALVHEVHRAYPYILPAYYVQDYEPLFFPEGSGHWHAARDSYELVPNCVLFAKTHWIIDKVRSEHGVIASKVEPSIDHSVYRPGPKNETGPVRIVAMIRPKTPRRGAGRTMRVFSKLAKRLGSQVEFHLFGCDPEESQFRDLTRDFDFKQHGVLRRPEVADLLAQADIFVDLSDYQAFGRTGLEAMACGCVAMVPVAGGADEYALDGCNALVVQSENEANCVARLEEVVRDRALLRNLQLNALVTAARYSVHRAAVSELDVMSRALTLNRSLHPVPDRRLLIVPAKTGGGSITGSGYVRCVLPYAGAHLTREYLVDIGASLPPPGSADAVILQRDVTGTSLEALQAWTAKWKDNGGRLVYDIDDDLLDPAALRSRSFTGDTVSLASKVLWLVQHADLVTVSTAALHAKCSELNANTRIIPNRLDGRLWHLDEKRDHLAGPYARRPDRVRIGYIGTASHQGDLEMVREAVSQIESEFPGLVEVEVVGTFERADRLFGTRVGLPRDHSYPNFVHWLRARVHWDIGIIPLVDNQFNASKSYLKFLEYAALDMAIVCSDVSNYKEIGVHEENCLMVPNTTERWYSAIKRLISDPLLRERLAESAGALVRRHTIGSAAGDYLDVVSG